MAIINLGLAPPDAPKQQPERKGEKEFLEDPRLKSNVSANFEKSIVIDAHLLKTYRACQQKFNLFEMQNVVSKGLKAAPSFGIAMHEGIAEFRMARAAGKGFDDSYQLGVEKLIRSYAAHMPPEMRSEVMQDDRRGPKNAIRLYTGFCEFFEPIGLEYLYVEVPFAMQVGTIEAPIAMEVRGGRRIWDYEKREVIYVGIIDAVIKEYGHVLVNDIKSTAWSITPKWLDGFKMDQGLIGYVLAVRELLGIDTQRGSVHAMWVQAEPKSRGGKPLNEYFHNKALFWDHDQFEEWHLNVLRTVAEIEHKKFTGEWIWDYGQNCGAFGGCDYRSICSAPPGVRKRLIEMDYSRGVWSPLEDERMQKLEW